MDNTREMSCGCIEILGDDGFYHLKEACVNHLWLKKSLDRAAYEKELLERIKQLEQALEPKNIIRHLQENPSAARQVVEALAGECGYQKKEKRGVACPTCKGHGCVNMEQDTCPECDGYGEI